MFQKMIVAFDGTDTGWDGLVLAMGLAKAFGSQVCVVYVYDEELAASSRGAAYELAEHADAVLAGARAQASQALAVSENIMRAAPCAVAVAPRGYRVDGGFVPQRIGVGWIATDEGASALEASCRIARATGGTVEVVTTTSASATVDDLDARARSAVERVLATLDGDIPVEVHAGVGKASEELVNRSRQMDLIVLGSRGYGAPRTMLFGSVSSQVVPEAQCPVMILAGDSRPQTGD